MNPFELIGAACLIVLALAALAAVAFNKGWIGLSPERIAKLRAHVDALQDKLDAKLAKKNPSAAAVVVKSKAERIAENNALVAAGAITREQADAANAAILTE